MTETEIPLTTRALLDYYRDVGWDPRQCAMYGCRSTALFFVQGWSCNGGGWQDRSVGGPDCGHAHMIPASMCEEHAEKATADGLATIGTTGD